MGCNTQKRYVVWGSPTVNSKRNFTSYILQKIKILTSRIQIKILKKNMKYNNLKKRTNFFLTFIKNCHCIIFNRVCRWDKRILMQNINHISKFFRFDTSKRKIIFYDPFNKKCSKSFFTIFLNLILTKDMNLKLKC